MPQTSMDYWVIAGVAVAVIGVLIAWRSMRKNATGPVQTMTDTSGSKQTATKNNVKQTMKNVTDGEQKG